MTDDDLFFENATVGRIAELHVRRLGELEERQAKRILEAYKRARQDLRDRLDALPAGTFQAQQVRGTLLQVEGGILELSRILKEEMSASAEETAELGVEHLLEETRAWDKEFTGFVVPINVDAAVVAADTRNLLINRYESSIAAYSESLRNRIAMGVTDAVIQGMSLSEVVAKLGKTFLAEEWRLQRIVRTELQNVYSTGKLRGMGALRDGDLPDLMKTLYHPMDHRTAADSKYAARKELIVPIDQPFRYTWKGEERVYMAPPDRPNDRSILIPYRKTWASR